MTLAEIIDQIQQKSTKLGMSKYALAKKSGLKLNTISRALSMRFGCTVNTLSEILNAVGLELSVTGLRSHSDSSAAKEQPKKKRASR